MQAELRKLLRFMWNASLDLIQMPAVFKKCRFPIFVCLVRFVIGGGVEAQEEVRREETHDPLRVLSGSAFHSRCAHEAGEGQVDSAAARAAPRWGEAGTVW